MKILTIGQSKMFKSLLIVVMFSVSSILQVSAQEASVKQSTATTAEGIKFNAWIPTQNVILGQNIIVFYKIANNSKKAIYLVHKSTDKVVIEDENIILPRPFVLVGSHEDYNYTFVKIAPGNIYNAQVKISQAEYETAKPWFIKVGFGYVTNLRGLNPRHEKITDPAPYKSLLSSRMKTLQLSDLSVEVHGNKP